jgi:hypothetical protein
MSAARDDHRASYWVPHSAARRPRVDPPGRRPTMGPVGDQVKGTFWSGWCQLGHELGHAIEPVSKL